MLRVLSIPLIVALCAACRPQESDIQKPTVPAPAHDRALVVEVAAKQPEATPHRQTTTVVNEPAPQVARIDDAKLRAELDAAISELGNELAQLFASANGAGR